MKNIIKSQSKRYIKSVYVNAEKYYYVVPPHKSGYPEYVEIWNKNRYTIGILKKTTVQITYNHVRNLINKYQKSKQFRIGPDYHRKGLPEFIKMR